MNKYTCPYCEAQLNAEGFIVLAAHCESGDRGLIFFSDELGNFSVSLTDNLKPLVKEGDKLHFHCSACQETLEYHENNKLARLVKHDEDGSKHAIIFSTIFGEQSTYKISEERTLSFGENALKYMDPDWYRKL
ncbi:hypothetical protein GYB22_00610 [bacterium]|nr:hypothetical protein [bacterium]